MGFSGRYGNPVNVPENKDFKIAVTKSLELDGINFHCTTTVVALSVSFFLL